MSHRGAERLASSRVPQLRRAIIIASNHDASIRTEIGRADGIDVLTESLGVAKTPNSSSLVGAASQCLVAVGTECNAHDYSAMKNRSAKWPAGRDIPQLRRIVKTSR